MCSLSKSNTMVWYNLCDDCLKIQKLMQLYSPDKVHEFIDKTLVIQEDKLDARLARTIKRCFKKKINN